MGTFAQNLTRIRTLRKLSQEELAKRGGVSQPAIAQFEAGKKTPKLYVTIKLAEALRTTIDDLVTHED